MFEIARARAIVHCWFAHGCKVYERMDDIGTTSVRCPVCDLVFWRRAPRPIR